MPGLMNPLDVELRIDPENPTCPFCGRPARCHVIDDASYPIAPVGDPDVDHPLTERPRYRLHCLRGHSFDF